MSKEKEGAHTPGPWQAEIPNRDDIHMGRITTAWKKDECFLVVAQCGLDHVYVGLPPWQRQANAHLIAAAPDLLAALKELLHASPASGWEQMNAKNRASAAIAKAEGRDRQPSSDGTSGSFRSAAQK